MLDTNPRIERRALLAYATVYALVVTTLLVLVFARHLRTTSQLDRVRDRYDALLLEHALEQDGWKRFAENSEQQLKAARDRADFWQARYQSTIGATRPIGQSPPPTTAAPLAE